jgi:hypothetical protein
MLLVDQDRIIIRQQQQLKYQNDLLEQKDQIIHSQGEQLIQSNEIIAQQDKAITQQQQLVDKQQRDLGKMDRISHELRMVKKWIHGIRSEKRNSNTNIIQPGIVQGTLSLDVDEWGGCQLNSRKIIAAHIRSNVTVMPKKRGGRHDFPEGLEEEVITLDVKNLPAGARLLRVEETRQLACTPLRWYLKVVRRPVYIVSSEDGLYAKQLVEKLPSHPIPKCKVDVSVLVMLVVDKFLYHIPTWRLRQRFIQYGITLPYSTLSFDTNKIADILEPLWHLLLKETINSRHLHVDESKYKVLDDSKKKGKKSHLGWMWGMLTPVQRLACFSYQPGRGKKDIADVLVGYKGYLMSDGYGAYTKYGRQPGVIHQQCLVHVRRYFVRAMDYDAKRAGYVLDTFFKPLYTIEAACKAQGLNYDEITEKRQEQSVPILLSFRQWMEQQVSLTITGTPLYKAIAYALAHFDGLMVYTTDGMLEPDNNILEAQIRPIALGRHSHMFAGSHQGGKRAAIIYSLLATCRLQGINPINWLDDVLRRIPDLPEERYHELLPQNWNPKYPAAAKSYA